MKVEEFLSRLRGVRRSGSGWTACCPAHEDGSPSLSIGEGDRGIVLRCFTGCSAELIVESLGLSMSDLFFEPQPGRSQKRAGGHEPVTLASLAQFVGLPAASLEAFGLRDAGGKVEVPYFDRDRSLIRVKIRSSLSGKPKYVWSQRIEGQPSNAPYGLWRLADDKRGAVVICEGESDAWILWHHGIPAIAMPGADTASLLEPRHLDGVNRVWIAADADEPGEKLATAIEQFANGMKLAVKRVPLPVGVKDIRDWFARSGPEFASQFRDACRRSAVAACVEPVIDVADIEPEPASFLIDPHIPKAGMTILAGKPGQGKSFLCAALAAGVTMGVGPNGSKIEPGGVLLLSSEDTKGVLAQRIRDCGYTGEGEHKIRLFDFDAADFYLGEEGGRRLDAMVEAYNPSLVILDPVITFMGDADPNKASEVRAALRPIANVARRHEIAILVTAHVRKGDAREAMDLIAGSGDFAAAIRSGLLVFQDPSDRKGRVIGHAKHNLSSEGPTLRYAIRPHPEASSRGVLYWAGESAYDCASLNRLQGQFDEVEEALHILTDELQGGMKRLASELWAKVRANGSTREAYRSALELLGAVRVMDSSNRLCYAIPDRFGSYQRGDDVPV